MAFTNRNEHLSGARPLRTPSGGEVVAVRYAIDLVAADLDINDCGAIGHLPAGCMLVSAVYDSDDLDTNGSPTIVAAIGPINSGETDLTATWAAGITASQTGTSAQVTFTPTAMRFLDRAADTLLGIKFTAAAATKAAGQVGLTLLYRAA